MVKVPRKARRSVHVVNALSHVLHEEGEYYRVNIGPKEVCGHPWQMPIEARATFAQELRAV